MAIQPIRDLATKLATPPVYLAKCGGVSFYCDPGEPLTPGCDVVVRSGRHKIFGILVDGQHERAKAVFVLHNRKNDNSVVCRKYPRQTIVRAVAVSTLVGDFPLA